jgi:hypothetical protein
MERGRLGQLVVEGGQRGSQFGREPEVGGVIGRQLVLQRQIPLLLGVRVAQLDLVLAIAFEGRGEGLARPTPAGVSSG